MLLCIPGVGCVILDRKDGALEPGELSAQGVCPDGVRRHGAEPECRGSPGDSTAAAAPLALEWLSEGLFVGQILCGPGVLRWMFSTFG